MNSRKASEVGGERAKGRVAGRWRGLVGCGNDYCSCFLLRWEAAGGFWAGAVWDPTSLTGWGWQVGLGFSWESIRAALVDPRHCAFMSPLFLLNKNKSSNSLLNCIGIKMNIIQAGFMITYSLIFIHFFLLTLREIKFTTYLWVLKSIMGPGHSA